MKLMDAVRKQTELSQRVLAGTATDADRAELASLTEKLAGTTQATGNANAVTAELTTLSATDFEKFLADEQAALAKNPDIDRLALLRENVDAVRKQVEKGSVIYAVRVPVIEKIDPMDAILDRLDEMEKKFDQRFRTGVGNPSAREAAAPAPAPAPEATTVAPAPAATPEAPAVEQQKDALSKDSVESVLTLSSVDALLAAIGALATKAADDSDDSDELRKLLDGTYDLAHLVTCAASIAQKAADLVEVAQSLEKAKAGRLAKPKAPPFPPANEEAPNGAPETDLDDEEESEEDMKGGKTKPPVKKDDGDAEAVTEATEPVEDVSKFDWSKDLATSDDNVGERFRALKARVQLATALMKMIGLPICRDGDKMFIPGSDDQIVDGIAALAARLGPLTKGHQPVNGARLSIEGFVTVAKLHKDEPDVFIYKECPEREPQREHLGEQVGTLNRTIDRSLRVLATEVRKVDEDTEERFVLSLVLEPNDGQDAPLHPDTQNDIYSAAEIRRAAHGWMEKGGAVDLQHNWKALGAERVKVVENYLAPSDLTIGEAKVLKGSWLLGLRVLNDELWAAAKDGKLGAFSIGGSARRVEVEAPSNG